jgi:NADH:ubiquinone oxidoreductase subunit 6 (subunit J)
VTAELAYGVYATLFAAAVGLVLLCPGAHRRYTRAGAVLAIGSVALLLTDLTGRLGAGAGIDGFFYVFALLAILSAGRVVTTTRPVYAALYLVVTVLAVAGLLVLAEAEFLAAALVIVYAGAIVVTYVFVIMLAQQSGATEYDTTAREPTAAVAAGFLLTAAICGAIAQTRWTDAIVTTPAPEGNTLAVASVLLSTYAISLEVAGVLLLVAIVGAIYIVRRDADTQEAQQT